MDEQVIKFRPPLYTPMARAVAVKLAGYTQQQLAEELGITQSSYGAALRGVRTSARCASHLSTKLNIPINTLFPDGRYDHVEREVA